MNVVLYTKEKCADCTFYKKYLELKSIPFEERDIFDEQSLERIRSTGIAGAPVIDINGTIHLAKQANLSYIKEQLFTAGLIT